MAWCLLNCHLNTLFLNSTAMGPITRGSKHLNLTALIWHQSRGPMPVMIPKHSFCEKGLSENQCQECYEVCCKGTESTCHWIMFDVYGTFSIVDNVPEFRKSSSVNFIRIKDSRPSKAVVSRNALKWVFIQILSVSQSVRWFRPRLNVSWLLVRDQTKHGPSLT